MRRRDFVSAVAAAGGLGLAGCLTNDGSGGTDGNGGGTATTTSQAAQKTTTTGEPSGTLTVATYESFVESPSSSPGAWIKEQFEAQYDDVTIEWKTPKNGVTEYVQRRSEGVSVDADVYVGLNVDDLVTIDDTLGEKRLFGELPRSDVSNAARVRSELEFDDPKGRVLPYDTGYISLVYDKGRVDAPQTFEDLTTDPYSGTLLAQNAQNTDSGQAFMLWTVATMGEDSYIDYWKELQNNDVKILGSWWSAYSAYLDGERPIVVSYSTDQVYANRDDLDMSKHQVGFLNDQGYANPEGMAVFQNTDKPRLATEFLNFMLASETQAELAVRNVQFPAVSDDHVSLPASFDDYAFRPPETVAYTYEELKGNLSTWTEEWAKTIASN
ncbi:thiamine ABC transporter substrate binding subunit [Haloarchaeobius sp. HME9146]|uniref:thiamine ABC transporter substrate-binding protein n=1 Tax=Haloarchaeobius sp. HME9146 TaxID=2978732 RepID=UPI0021BFBE13|nr:thiamine ABC transporter substrate-binding protein [Haloarchaeobius sp. HME9146]MCT9094874.1 thiamine ABC transporter substrate-binding protein [Haloarchaeobius sp. HME9146]